MTSGFVPIVGFDLDMTLIDSRPGIGAVYDALAAETGVAIDTPLITSRLGPPLAVELANWFPAEQVPAQVARYRELYPGLAVASSPALPGAVDALAAVHAHGGRTIVVTSKVAHNAVLHLEHLALPVDDLVGDRFAAGKGPALAERGATVYVGDHLADIEAARAAGAVAVAVASGPYDVDALRAGGADVVLPDLTGFAGWLDGYVLSRRLADLDAALAGLGSVCVAFSGGADSAFVLATAVRVLGADRVVAATAVSASLPAAELSAATAFADRLGVRQLTPSTEELARPGYVANAGDRCAHCKSELLDVLRVLAADRGLAAVVTGTNADDVRAGFRPGIAAAAQRGARTPLADAGLTKAQVRAASRAAGLPTWDKPAAACLASRVAYGVLVTRERLARIEAAEAALRAALDGAGIAVRDLRIRDLDGVAMVEVDLTAVPALAARPELLATVQGFDRVELDPRGFRSGSMNELLPDPERYR